jgi:hypothetical protein
VRDHPLVQCRRLISTESSEIGPSSRHQHITIVATVIIIVARGSAAACGRPYRCNVALPPGGPKGLSSTHFLARTAPPTLLLNSHWLSRVATCMYWYSSRNALHARINLIAPLHQHHQTQRGCVRVAASVLPSSCAGADATLFRACAHPNPPNPLTCLSTPRITTS